MKEMNIPVGVSDFEEIRKNGYYYIDKSGLIGELLSRTGTKVTLITRPRRFGKTLGMSMLENFFDIRKDSRKLFEGLEITENQALCVEWMNQYPTIFVSFRQVDGLNFTGAYDMLTMVIADLYNKHLYHRVSPVDIPTGWNPRTKQQRRVALADFSAAPWRGFEKSERGPNSSSLFQPLAAVVAVALG